MKEYDPETLKKVQEAELSILRTFVSFCDKNDIVYFGIAGTGIGALRHGGFIPWDDDIDVAMPRADYERFAELAKKELADEYIILNGEEYPNYPLLTTRLVKKGTEFREHTFKDIDCPLGIFLDIYPLDNIPDDEKLFRKQARAAFFYSKLLILRSIPFPVLGFKGIKAKAVHAVCGVCHFFLKIFGVSKKKLYAKCLKISKMYNNEPSERFDFLCDTTAYLNIHKKSGVFPLKKIKFEDIDLNFPGNIEENLKAAYGDYMVMPPIEKRKNHLPYRLKFEDEEVILNA